MVFLDDLNHRFLFGYYRRRGKVSGQPSLHIPFQFVIQLTEPLVPLPQSEETVHSQHDPQPAGDVLQNGCHHSTSCIQNSRRQSRQVTPRHPFFTLTSRLHGLMFITPSSKTVAFGHCSRNTLCSVLRGCSFDQCSTKLTIFLLS